MCGMTDLWAIRQLKQAPEAAQGENSAPSPA